MQRRSIAGVIILSLFTCGIYSIYWFYVVAEDLNRREPEDPLMNYILAILVSIVTCGIYGIYWNYKFFKKLDKAVGEDNVVLNFILTLFGFSIVSQAIAQNSINNHQ
ncbi:MAG: DUF4234 domain-containing protein [Erysipelotrichaceae bacterium]|nr:DUF4234 domain-containing protein [Erysipelotrichaceae bacterium]